MTRKLEGTNGYEVARIVKAEINKYLIEHEGDDQIYASDVLEYLESQYSDVMKYERVEENVLKALYPDEMNARRGKL